MSWQGWILRCDAMCARVKLTFWAPAERTCVIAYTSRDRRVAEQQRTNSQVPIHMPSIHPCGVCIPHRTVCRMCGLLRRACCWIVLAIISHSVERTMRARLCVLSPVPCKRLLQENFPVQCPEVISTIHDMCNVRCPVRSALMAYTSSLYKVA